MHFHAGKYSFRFPRSALIMGILNVTPDSFFDGGSTFSTESAISRGLELVHEGADILDVGGESSRPGALPVTEQEEMQRVLPVVRALSTRIKVPISVDTTKASVAFEALHAGASIINDVGGRADNTEMMRVLANGQAGYICMHMNGTPQSMQTNPVYHDVVREVLEFFRNQMNELSAYGVNHDRIVFDPGFGFGKSLEHNLQLLAALRRLEITERPVLIGVSRKSFIDKLLRVELADRLPASLACATIAVASGVQLVRAHDVRETVQAVRMAEAILSRHN